MSAGLLLEQRMAELTARQVPFVKATVVRARRPASARPGDTALVLEDGRMEGFVGGVCAEATVRLQALRTLRSGESLLLRISPRTPAEESGDPGAGGIDDGVLDVANPCLSGGELEIFLEPLRPPPRVLVLGETPIGRSLVALGPALGYAVRHVTAAGLTAEDLTGVQAVVVASHGRDEEPVLTLAARCAVPYIGLVGSRRRGEAVLSALDLTCCQRGRIHTPAGLWIGARSPGEVAVSILAEIIAVVRGVGEALPSEPEPEAVDEEAAAVDPVCGMTVAPVADTPYSDVSGERRWFCCAGCRDTYEADPARY